MSPLSRPWIFWERKRGSIEAAIFGDGLHVIGREGVDVEKEITTLFQGQKIAVKTNGMDPAFPGGCLRFLD